MGAIPIVTITAESAICTCADFSSAGQCQHAREAVAQQTQLMAVRWLQLLKLLDPADLEFLLFYLRDLDSGRIVPAGDGGSVIVNPDLDA